MLYSFYWNVIGSLNEILSRDFDAQYLLRVNLFGIWNSMFIFGIMERKFIFGILVLRNNGTTPFQPVALEVQGSLGESSESFITRLCKMLCRSHDDQRAGSFLKQRISMALQIGNAACVLGTVSDRDAFEEIYYI